MSVDTMVELNDSEIPQIEGVLRHLNAKQGKVVNLEGFRKEVIERFAEIGFKVDANAYEAKTFGKQDLIAWKIVIRERLVGEFDPNQQVREVVSDILGLGTGGVIPTGTGAGGTKLWTPPGAK